MSDTPQILSKNPAFAWSPISRRFVKRSGSVYKRLVMAGVVVDEEVNAQLVGPPRPTMPRNNVSIPDTVEPTAVEARVVGKETAAARKAAKSLIAQHVDQLEGLPPDQVEEILRRLLATKLGAPEPAPAKQPQAAPAPRGTQPIKVKFTAAAPAKSRRAKVRDLFSTTDDTGADSDDDE
jgi:hypothetical protein